MPLSRLPLLAAVALLVLGAGHSSVASAALPIAQSPLYLQSSTPPLNMLVMGKDHKIYYEAYNDASDLNGDGTLDVGYRGWELRSPAPTDGSSAYKIDYYGYFNSFVCYTHDGDKFVPSSATTNKQCSGKWSGDFLNYLTTSRMDALRRVLYGGYRETDTAASTILQGSFFPQDAHSWGKEYQSVARDGYNIANYAPLALPTGSTYHLFAVTTVENNTAPLLRVLKNSEFRVWNWLSIEGPVGNEKCFNSGNQRVNCQTSSGNLPFPGHPGSRAAFNTMQSTYAIADYRFGGGAVSTINCTGNACNPYNAAALTDDNFLTIVTGRLRTALARTYQFRIAGDDNVDFALYNADSTARVDIGCYPNGQGFNAAGCATSGDVTLAASGDYSFLFRHEEGSGDDGYRLEWRMKDATGNGYGAWSVITGAVLNASNVVTTAGISNGQMDTYNLTPSTNVSTRDDYKVRVQVCPTSPAAVRDATCEQYPNSGSPIYKPTGILHDFGESQKMYFGLITGSQTNNLEGGILRRNVRDFATEINAQTGVFLANVDGIVRTINRLRMIGGGYNNSQTNNLGQDYNWNWANGTGNCPSIGDRALANGECRMWGNPIAEMMYESMRYFAGAAAATPRFVSTSVSQGVTEENTLGLTKEAWLDPYKSLATGGLGYRACAKPVQTVISDINPSYDGDLPGSGFTGTTTTTGVTPAEISGFNAQTQGATIWNKEFGGSRNVLIGDVGNVTDGAPTVKSASSFGNIRGLSPEEPTKGGTYFAASVAHFAKVTDLNVRTSPQNMSTYSVALASPLPRIEVPIGTGTITLVPFAKTVSGTFGDGTRKPTNTIVDFYVQEINNFPGQTVNNAINGGRAKAIFRINYEDVEQGNDHDMDAIARYEVTAKADGTVDVQLFSEYAAGSANQYMGYTLSGTNSDGVYLEICDLKDGTSNPTNSIDKNMCASNNTSYVLNTPPGRSPGYCATVPAPADCAGLQPVSSVRNFTPATGRGATTLNNPLWYAAKYGGFDDVNRNGLPDTGEWDKKVPGSPDNYFLVTNALTLKKQLEEAFSKIEADSKPTGGVAASGARRDSGFLAYIPRYYTEDWTGEVQAFRVTPNGDLGTVAWTATSLIPAADDRKIFAVVAPGASTARVTSAFTRTAMTGAGGDVKALMGIPVATSNADVDKLISYLRGDQTLEVKNGGAFRNRARRLGDILNSQPEVLNTASYSYAQLDDPDGGGLAYSTFLGTKKTRRQVVFVGSNDGMLHAFDASSGNTNSGKEVFAVVPNAALANMKDLAGTGYTHRYYVDGSPIQRDAYINGGWKTVLLSGLGAGGKSIVALDVTNPAVTNGFTKDSILWEFTDADLGYTFGQPRIGILQDKTWVAVFGNGYNSTNNAAYMYVVRLSDGVLLKKIRLGTGDTDASPNGLASPELTTLDSDVLIDTAYAGDYKGRLWKVNLSGAQSTWGIAGGGSAPLFTAVSRITAPAVVATPQQITGSIALSPHHLGGVMAFFGTGRYMLEGDNTVGANPVIQTFYGIWDKAGVNALTPVAGRSDLQQQTLGVQGTAEVGLARSASNNAIDWATKSGWYMDLILNGGSAIGERVLGLPTVGMGRVVFTTFTPLGDECTPGGENWLYVLNAVTGGVSLSTPSFTPTVPTGAGAGTACSGGACAVAGASLGSGPPTVAPPIVTTPPNSETNPDGTPVCTISCNKIKIGVLTPEGTVDFMLLLPGRQSWRQMD